MLEIIATNRTRRWAGLTVAAAFLAGCATAGPFDDRAWAQPETARAHHAPPPTDRSAPLSLPKNPGPEDYAKLAAARHPMVAVAGHRRLRLEARIDQAGALPDPTLTVAPIGEMAQTAAGEVGTMASLSQRLDWPAQLQARTRAATLEASEAAIGLDEAQRLAAQQARQAFWDYYDAAQALRTVEQTRPLLAQARQAAQALYRAGQGGQAQVLQLGVAISELQTEQTILEERLSATRAALLATIAGPVDMDLPRPEPRELRPLSLQLSDLLAAASDGNPELRRLRERIAAARQRLVAAKLERVPDVTVGATWNRVEDEGLSMAATGDDQWWLSLGVNLPIWSRKYDAIEEEARQAVLESIAQLHQAHNMHQAHVARLLSQIQAQQAQARTLEEAILPQAQQGFEAVMSSYRAGQAGYESVLESWRSLLRLKRLYHQSIAAMEKAVAELRFVLGHKEPDALAQESSHE